MGLQCLALLVYLNWTSNGKPWWECSVSNVSCFHTSPKLMAFTNSSQPVLSAMILQADVQEAHAVCSLALNKFSKRNKNAPNWSFLQGNLVERLDSLLCYNLITTDSFAIGFSWINIPVDIIPLVECQQTVTPQLSLFSGCGIYIILQIKSWLLLYRWKLYYYFQI